MAKKEAFLQFLKAARSLQDRGLSKEAIVQFAKNEFGELSELFKKQIDSLFKPKKGIENIKLKDEVFDDTVVKMQFDDSGVPFNPKNPLKTKSLTYEEAIAREEAKAAADEDYIMKVFDPEDFAKGGRAGYYTGGMVDVEPNLSDIGHGSDALMARTRLVSPDGQATTSTGLNYLLAEDNDNIRVPFAGGGSYDYGSMQHKINSVNAAYKRYLNMRKGKQKYKVIPFEIFSEEFAKENFAEGGRIGFADGNGVADEDAEKAALGKRVRELMDEGFDMGEAVRKAMSEGYAEGGRIGFSKGKIAKEVADKGRRGFMKAAGAAGAGIAALKTGLLGFGKEAAPVVEKAVETVQGTPQYFFDLISKIKMFGKKSKFGPQERVDEYSYTGANGDDYTLTEDIVTGDARIVKDKTGGVQVGEDEVVDGVANRSVMEYKSGKGAADEGTGGALADEYDEYEVKFDMDGTEADADDMSEIIRKQIIEETSDKTTKVKKASGGIARMIGE